MGYAIPTWIRVFRIFLASYFETVGETEKQIWIQQFQISLGYDFETESFFGKNSFSCEFSAKILVLISKPF